MAKQLNVNMNFTADTSNVESNLNKLKASLNQISSMPVNLQNASSDLNKATAAAKDLQRHLNEAFNVKTGNIDLGRLQNSITQSGQSLKTLSMNLLGAGTTGQKTFLQLQTAIEGANINLTKANTKIGEFTTVLKNTARWQISSTALHGFMSAVQNAISYTKDLNKSLNNIRIVTGQSSDDMAKFAEQANKSAKALSSTTTAYTNAALIYYQQGLGEQEVKERTDTTIKMSNVTDQSAQEVSSYMTAIWNNFDDGSESLEHYADVITALGAKTASSSREIADGLEKFAAIGKTVGLSYDYATTALATVVAQTRQSADVVGTAFKTLFARIESLKLGDTLEDGTTLGQYSAALAKVGVNIKDASGQLKAMDQILDETGAKWKTLGSDQQIALAQSVAGIRQYSQFMALMSNWDKFQSNLTIAQNSEGSLQDQADIYAESWAAANKRVKANMQDLYGQLIDDENIIKMTNAAGDLVNAIAKITEGIGGVKTLLLAVSTIAISKLKPAITSTFNEGLSNITLWRTNLKESVQEAGAAGTSKSKAFFGNVGKGSSQIQKEQLLGEINSTREQLLGEEQLNSSFRQRLEASSKINDIQNQIEKSSKRLTDEEKEKLGIMQKEASTIADTLYQKQQEEKILAREKRDMLNNRESLYRSNKGGARSIKTFEYAGSGEKEIGYSKGQGITFSKDTEKKEVSDRANNMSNQPNTLFDSKKFYDAVEEGNVQIQSGANHIKLWAKEEKILVELGKEVLEGYVQIGQVEEKVEQIRDKELQDANQLRGVYNSIFEELVKTGQISGSQATAYKQRLEAATEIADIEKVIDDILTESKLELQDHAQLVGVTTSEMQKAENLGRKRVANATELTAAQQELNNKFLETNMYLEKALTKARSLGGALQSGMQALSSLAMGASMLKNTLNTFKEFKNGEASGFDLFSNMAFSLPMVIAGAKSAVGALGELRKANEAMNSVTKISNALTVTKNALEGEGNSITLTGAQTQDLKNAKDQIANILTKRGIGDTEAEIAATQLSSTIKAGETVTIDANTVAIEAETAAKEANAVATMGYLAIAAAAIVAIAAVGYTIYKTTQMEEDALKKSTENLKKAKEAANEAQQEYDSLLSTISNYKEAREGLDDLKKGTLEWNAAVIKLNGQVLELISNYQGLGITAKNVDGVLTLTDEDLDKIVKEQNRRNLVAQGEVATTTKKNLSDKNSLDFKLFYKEFSEYSDLNKQDTAKLIVDYANGNEEAVKQVSQMSNEAREAIQTATEAIVQNNKISQLQNQILMDAANSNNDTYNSLKSYGFDEALKVAVEKRADDRRKEAEEKYAYEASDFGGAVLQEVDNAQEISAQAIKTVFGENAEKIYRNVADSAWGDIAYGVAGVLSVSPALGAWIGHNANTSDTEANLAQAYAEEKFGAGAMATNTGGGKFNVVKADGTTVEDISYEVAHDTMVNLEANRLTEDESKQLLADINTNIGKINDSGLNLDSNSVYALAEQMYTGNYDLSKISSTDYQKLVEDNDKLSPELQAEIANFSETTLKNVVSGAVQYSGVSKDTSVKTDEAISELKENLSAQDISLLAKVEDPSKFITFNEDGSYDINFDGLNAAIKEQGEIEIDAKIDTLAEEDTKAQAAGLDAAEVSGYGKYLENLSESVADSDHTIRNAGITGALNDNAEAAENMAREVMRMDKGIETLSGNWEEWGSVLENSSKSSKEYYDAFKGVTSAMEDMFDMNPGALEDLPVWFFDSAENADLLERAAQGDAKAIDDLRAAVAKTSFEELAKEKIDAGMINMEGVENDTDKLNTLTQQFADLQTMANNFQANPNMDTGDFTNALNTMISTMGMTQEEVIKMCDALSITPTFAEATDTVTGTTPITTTTHQIDPGSIKYDDYGNMVEYTERSSVDTTQEPVDTEVGAFAVQYNPGNKTPQSPDISSISVKATGSSNNYSGSNSGGKSSSGGGGGKGSSKSAKDFKSSRERFHQTDKLIESNTKAFEKLARAKDKAYGKDKLSLMDQEIKNLETAVQLEKARIAEANRYAAADKSRLIAAAAAAGAGTVTFDEYGNISNYEVLFDRADAIAKGAYGSSDDDTISGADEKYNELTEAIKEYEDSLAQAADSEEKMLDYLDQIAEIKLEKIQYKVDVQIDLSEREIKSLEFKISQWERANARKFKDAAYIGLQSGILEQAKNQYEINRQGINELLAQIKGLSFKERQSIFNGTASQEFIRGLGLTEQEIEALQGYQDGMLDAAQQISDAQDAIYQIFNDNLDVYKDNFERMLKKVEDQKSLVSSLKDVYTLLGDGNEELINQMRQTILQATEAQGLAYRKSAEETLKQIQSLEFEVQLSKDAAEKAALEESLNNYKDYYNELQNNMVDSLKETLDLIKEKLEANVEEIGKIFERGLAGSYGSFSNLELSLDLEKETTELYLKPYERQYELSKLTRDVQKAINDTDNIKGKQKLLILQNKINKSLQEGADITQYDLDVMRAQYDLEVAKIALEEAQNTKSMVRMQRNDNGSWGYVYTADYDKIKEAQDDYEEAMNKRRELDVKREEELTDKFVEIYKDYRSRMEEVMSNTALSDEERQQMIDELNSWLVEQQKLVYKGLQTVVDNEKEMFEKEAEFYEEHTDYNIECLGKWKKSFEDLTLAQKSGFESMDEAMSKSEEVVKEYSDTIQELYQQAQEDSNKAMEEFGINTDYATNSMRNLNYEISEAVKNIAELCKGLEKANSELPEQFRLTTNESSTIDKAETTYDSLNSSYKTASRFDTGGYTGSWGSTDGKLAFLHQKELVLNEEQTKDLLDTVKYLERYKDYQSNLLNYLSHNQIAEINKIKDNKNNEALQQEVTIKADFPNVRDHFEIEQAINNLINTASQYANRK